MHSARGRLQVVMLWSMVPLTFLSSMPRIGCICANGDYKLFCDGHYGTCCQQVTKGPSDSHACCCCHRSHRASAEGNVSADGNSTKDCCHRSGGGHSRVAPAKRCCTPVAGMTVLPRASQPVSVPDVRAQLLQFCLVDSFQSPVGFPAVVSTRSPDLPVPDLVIAHQVLVI